MRRLLAVAALIWSVAGCNSTGSPPPTPSPTSAFTAIASMSVPRQGHVAALLSNGEVLIAGGNRTSTETLQSADLYDPATGHFTTTSRMTVARAGATATALANGRILIAGGYRFDESGATLPLAAAELYDPVSGTFSVTGSMREARYDHTATLLPNGRVLVVGGTGDRIPLESAEQYDPSTGTWAPAGTMATSRTGHVAALLPGGRVLVAGGLSADIPAAPTYLATAELYDPASAKFTATASMVEPRYEATATIMGDGRVLVAGGIRFEDVAHRYSIETAEVYEPAAGTFGVVGSMAAGRTGAATVLLPNGRVLVAGGMALQGETASYLATAEVYRPGDGAFGSVGAMTTQRYGATATLLKDGHVLIAGGADGSGILGSAELYQP